METLTVGLTSAAQPFIAADGAVDVAFNLDMMQACERQWGLKVHQWAPQLNFSRYPDCANEREKNFG